MSKESMLAGQACRCGVVIYYTEYHYPHCPEKDSWELPKKEKVVKNGQR